MSFLPARKNEERVEFQQEIKREREKEPQGIIVRHIAPVPLSTGRAPPTKGPFTYDVHTEGGGGVGSKAESSTDGMREWDSHKGRGSKNPNFLRTSYKNSPQAFKRGIKQWLEFGTRPRDLGGNLDE